MRFVDLNAFTATIDGAAFGTTYDETRQVEDPNGNVSSVTYDLIAVVAGETMTVEDVITSSSFPFSIQLNAAVFEGWLGLPSGTLTFGDNCTLRAKVTRNDGVVYTTQAIETLTAVWVDGDGNLAEASDSTVIYTAGNFDPSRIAADSTYYGGNTQENLYKGSYANAMEFKISIACPFVPAEAVGMYLITNDPFGTTLDDASPIEAVLNEDGDGIIFKDMFKHPEMFDIEFIFTDPAIGFVEIERQPAWHCDNFGCPYGEGRVDGEGSFFTCIGAVNVNLNHTVDAGSFGNFNLQLQKQ